MRNPGHCFWDWLICHWNVGQLRPICSWLFIHLHLTPWMVWPCKPICMNHRHLTSTSPWSVGETTTKQLLHFRLVDNCPLRLTGGFKHLLFLFNEWDDDPYNDPYFFGCCPPTSHLDPRVLGHVLEFGTPNSLFSCFHLAFPHDSPWTLPEIGGFFPPWFALAMSACRDPDGQYLCLPVSDV